MGRKGGGAYCELRAGNPVDGGGIKLHHSQKLEHLTALKGGSTPWDPSVLRLGDGHRWVLQGTKGAQDMVSGNPGRLQICH